MASVETGMDNPIEPSYYQHENGIETIDYILAVTRGLNGAEGSLAANVIKYVSRFRSKGNPAQDLQKAKWYLHRLIEEVEEDHREFVKQECFRAHQDFVQGAQE